MTPVIVYIMWAFGCETDQYTFFSERDMLDTLVEMYEEELPNIHKLERDELIFACLIHETKQQMAGANQALTSIHNLDLETKSTTIYGTYKLASVYKAVRYEDGEGEELVSIYLDEEGNEIEREVHGQ